jgi:hypothetical protein
MSILFHTPLRPRPGDRYLSLDLSHNAKRSVIVHLRFHLSARAHPVNDKDCGRMVVELYPYLGVRLCLDLAHMEQALGHHPRNPGTGIIYNTGPIVKVAEFRSVTCLALAPPRGFRLRLRELKLGRDPRPGRILTPHRPVVDKLGQLIPRRWPGKASRIVPVKPGPVGPVAAPVTMPVIRVPRYRHPGRFTVDLDGKRHWIITPEGNRLFSIGANCVSPFSGGPTRGMEHLFSWLPPRRGSWKEAWSDPVTKGVSFYTANLMRRYGADWREKWASLAGERLRAWGFNTIGNWSNPLAWKDGRNYYTLNASWWDDPKTADGWGLYCGFPDVWSRDFERRADEAARRGTRPHDLRLLGYFVLNEPGWQRTDLHLAGLALRTDRAPATREFLLQWIRHRYGRRDARPTPADMDRMREMMVERYFEVVCGALRRHDPNHLLLGIRFYGTPPSFLMKSMRFMDVVSFNNYETRPNPGHLDLLHKTTGKPVLIGEFHMGAVDRGPTCYGLVAVKNQRERGIAYAHYMEAAAATPWCVGAHWFQYADQPALGRFDGENYNIGVVDVTDRPYPEMVSAFRECHPRLPLIHSGKARPRTRAPRTEETGLGW